MFKLLIYLKETNYQICQNTKFLKVVNLREEDRYQF